MSDSQLAASVLALLDGTADTFLVCAGAGAVVSQKTASQAKTLLALVKADVGLGSVDNTADTAKPVSTAQQTAIDAKIGGSVGSTTNRLVKSSGTGGLTLQSTGITVDSSNNVSGLGTVASGAITSSGAVVGTGTTTGSPAFSWGAIASGFVTFKESSELVFSCGTEVYRIGSGYIRIATAGTYRIGDTIGISRNADGVAEINSTSVGTFRDLKLRDLTASGLICAGVYTVATLPSAAANSYKFATVSDSSVTTFGSTVAGGGSSKVMVFSNGTNWTVAAA